MESPVTRIIILAAAISAVVAVVAIMWTQLNANSAVNDPDVTRATTEELCDALGGTWASNSCS